jgi:hypothetical protein
VFTAIAALALASATAHPISGHPISNPATPALNPNSPWWERVTVTVTDDGQTQSCSYQTSQRPDNAKACSVVGGEAALAKTSSSSSSSGAKDQVTRITFERRFSPEAKAELTDLKPGDVLIGGQVMALAIDAAGAVKGCKVVATSGSVTPQYGCDEAAAERFEASAATAHAHAANHAGYLTVLVYGHSEHVV